MRVIVDHIWCVVSSKAVMMYLNDDEVDFSGQLKPNSKQADGSRDLEWCFMKSFSNLAGSYVSRNGDR
jgi:hypothetical protein